MNAAAGLEILESVTESEVVDAESLTERAARKGRGGGSEDGDNLLREGRRAGRRRGVLAEDLEVRADAVRVGDQSYVDGRGGGGGAVFAEKPKMVVVAKEIGVVVPPRVEVARAAEGLPRIGARALAHVVNEHDGHAMTP
jgi:hypothetical protein